MRMPNTHGKPLAAVTLLTLLTMACAPKPVTEDELALTSVESMVKEKGLYHPIEDQAAMSHFDELSKLAAKGQYEKLRFKVYALAPPQGDYKSHIKQRGTALNIEDGRFFYPDDNIEGELNLKQDETVRVVGVRNKQFELAYNRDSGSELFVDNQRFHDGKGVPVKQLKDDAFYVETADLYIKKKLTDEIGKTKLYAYRLRKYLDAIAKEGEEPEITASQIAVAYNTAVEGIAVIGPGGKAVVHMSPTGDVVGHEIIVRPITKAIAEITGANLLNPNKARDIVVSKIKERNIPMEKYILVRSEFGYLSLGRNSTQQVLAPYYAFFFEPKSEKVVGRTLLEIVPAVTDPKIAQLMEEDMQRESRRKQRILDKAGEPDQRKIR